MKTPVPNPTAMQELIKHDVPKHLHKLVTAFIVCITTDFDYRYEKAKEICDYESLELSDEEGNLSTDETIELYKKEIIKTINQIKTEEPQ